VGNLDGDRHFDRYTLFHDLVRESLSRRRAGVHLAGAHAHSLESSDGKYETYTRY